MIESQSKNTHTLFILYESGQVEELERFFNKNQEKKNNSRLIAMSLDVEAKLLDYDMTFSSIKDYKKIANDLLESEDEMILPFFKEKFWEEFKYRDIDLLATYKFMFMAYFQRVRYFANLLIPMLGSYPNVVNIFLFPPSETVSKAHGILAYREINVVADCLKIIAQIHNIEITTIPLSINVNSLKSSLRPHMFTFKKAVFDLLFNIWNFIIGLICPSSHPRLIISDYWNNIGSSIKLLEKGQCIFLDRKEIKNIDWSTLFKYRIKFVHIQHYLSSGGRKAVRDNAERLVQKWNTVKKTLPPIFIWHNYSFDILLHQAIDDIVGDSHRILGEIEGTYLLYKKYKPDLVLLRASVSAQTHFSILPMVAKKCSIHSVELQHGLEYLGVGSWSREHVAEYIAIYGPLIQRELLSIGYSSEKIYEIGSPRFDGYIKKATSTLNKDNKKRFTILCIAPDIRPFEIYDTYSAQDYFKSISEAILSHNLDVHIIIKLRPGPAHETIFKRIVCQEFSTISHSIAQYESLEDLYSEANLVISCFSTAILEAMQFGIPVMIPTLNPVDEQVVRFHFLEYSKAGAIILVNNQKDFNQVLREFVTNNKIHNNMRDNIQLFMAKNFLFDGKSSERYASLIRKLSEYKNK